MSDVSRRIRLVAIDLDGTLIGPGNRVDERDAAAIRAAVDAGVIVVPASARWYQATLLAFERVGARVRASIASGGADVRGLEGEVVLQEALPDDFVEFLSRLCDEADWRATVAYPDCAVRRGPAPTLARTPPWIRFVPAFGKERPAGPALAALVEVPSDHPAAQTLERWDSVSVLRARATDGAVLLTCTAAGADKGSALRALQRHLGLAPMETAAIGDSEVDLPMFAAAGISAAVSTADARVRSAATFSVGPGGGGGVAEALERFLA